MTEEIDRPGVLRGMAAFRARRGRLAAALALISLAVAGGACVSGETESADDLLDESSDELLCTGPGCTCNSFYSLGLIQSSYGQPGNFEVVAPASEGGLVHYHRQNSGAWSIPWGNATPFASGDINGSALIQSNFTTNGVGHLETVYVAGSSLYTANRDDGGTGAWSASTLIDTGLRGTPGFIQSDHGTKGNFEVVVPVATGGLRHYYRNNDAAGLPWAATVTFGTGSGTYDSVALIQSNYGGNLEVIARTGSTLHHYYRDRGTGQWGGPTQVATGVSGSAAFYQSSHGTKGNFELVTPLASGGMAHYYRDNDQSGNPWYGPSAVPNVSGSVSAVAAIESSYGHLEWVARHDGQLSWGFRDDGATWAWNGPYAFSAQPCCDPAVKGKWDAPMSAGMVGIHAAMLRTGNVLFFAFMDNNDAMGISRVLNPLTGGLTIPSPSTPDMFCSGHSALPDGKILVAGGHHNDVNKVNLFDPGTNAWSSAGTLNDGRWYPTTATLDDGRVLILSGSGGTGGPIHDWGNSTENASKVNNTWQLYSSATGLSAAKAVTPSPFSNDGFTAVDLYPFVYQLPNGKVLVHSRTTTRFLNVASETWDSAAYSTVFTQPRTYPRQGTSVLLPLLPDTSPAYRAKVLVAGGAGTKWATPSTGATSTAEVLDLGAASPAWQSIASMHYPRVLQDAVLLPDGKVFMVGGSAIGHADDGSRPVLTPEIYDPAGGTWTEMCPMRVPRSYHSTALLLPDARVLVAGKDGLFNAAPYHYPEQRVEIYSPPYLFAGSRPTISSAPATLSYGEAFTVGVGTVAPASISRVALIRLGATTHGVNMDQRYVGLTITGTGASTLSLTAPPDGKVAPPGHYMLFLVSSSGVPSVAAIVKLS
ncbi:MAG: DUF1929 domain-containing protein [Polyangiaceae bacterium]